MLSAGALVCGCSQTGRFVRIPARLPIRRAPRARTRNRESRDLSQLDVSKYSGFFGKVYHAYRPNHRCSGHRTLSCPTAGRRRYTATGVLSLPAIPVSPNIQFTSPDKEASVLIQTSHDYLQSYDTSGAVSPPRLYRQGKRTSSTSPIKMPGRCWIWYFNGIFGTGGTVVDETPVPDEVQSILDQAAQLYLTTLVNGINQVARRIWGHPAQASRKRGHDLFAPLSLYRQRRKKLLGRRHGALRGPRSISPRPTGPTLSISHGQCRR